MSKLVDYPKVQHFIQDRIDSREWWILVIDGPESATLALRIATRFYTGDDGPLFNLLCNSCGDRTLPFRALAFAAKRCLSAQQLSEFIGAPVPEERDVLIPASTRPEVVQWLGTQFHWRGAGSDS